MSFTLVEFYLYTNPNAAISSAELLVHYQPLYVAKFSPILIGLNWSLDAIVFIRGDTINP